MYITVGVTLLSTICSISAMYVDVPKMAAYFYMYVFLYERERVLESPNAVSLMFHFRLQILIGTTDSILNAVIVELYPTNVR